MKAAKHLHSEELCSVDIWTLRGEETFVDFEQGLNSCIRQIRDVLGDDSKSPRFIETLPRRGYRFLVPFEGEASVSAPSAPGLLRIGIS
jgi:DNA-binding winged helix-turn-helix (wHTH) protein